MHLNHNSHIFEEWIDRLVLHSAMLSCLTNVSYQNPYWLYELYLVIMYCYCSAYFFGFTTKSIFKCLGTFLAAQSETCIFYSIWWCNGSYKLPFVQYTSTGQVVACSFEQKYDFSQVLSQKACWHTPHTSPIHHDCVSGVLPGATTKGSGATPCGKCQQYRD